MRRWILPVAALGLVALAAGPGWAETPVERLRSFFSTANRALADPSARGAPAARVNAMRAAAGDLFDVRDTARLALGPEGAARTAAEQAEFARLYGEVFESSFASALLARSRAPDRIDVWYLGESIDGGAATVRTAIEGRAGQEVSVDYRMADRGGRWVVRDAAIDGVSLAANLRAQFTRVIRTSSYADLVRQMQVRAPAVMAADSPPERGPSTTASAPAAPVPGPGRGEAAPPVLERMPMVAAAPAPAVREPEPRAAAAREAAPAAVPRAEPSAGAEAARSRRGYWVQVGAFRTIEAARRLAATLRGQEGARGGRSDVLVAAGSPQAPLARVRVGPFPHREEAASKMRALQARGYKAFIASAED